MNFVASLVWPDPICALLLLLCNHPKCCAIAEMMEGAGHVRLHCCCCVCGEVGVGMGVHVCVDEWMHLWMCLHMSCVYSNLQLCKCWFVETGRMCGLLLLTQVPVFDPCHDTGNHIELRHPLSILSRVYCTTGML